MKTSFNQTYKSAVSARFIQQFTTLTFILLILLSTNAFAQPNDDCLNATTVPALDGSCNNFNTTGSTFDLFNGDCVAGINNIWFSFVAQGPDLIVQAGAGGFVPEITVVQFNPTPCDFASATQLGCSVINELGITGGLIPGNTYYILITPSNNTGGIFNLCVNNPIPPVGPPNDDPCNAEPLNPNGTCENGTTVAAATDFLNPDPACVAATNENAVWYSVTLNTGNNALDVTLNSLGVTGDVGLLIGTLNPCSSTTFLLEEAYCGPPTTVNVTGLTEGQTYYIQVSSSDADAGDFQICATEMGPPPGCSLNNFCAQAEVIPVTSGQPCTPTAGCNIGASPEPGLTGCAMATEEVVWYSFTSDATAGLLSLSITSVDITAPTVQVFTGNCAAFNDISGCITGSNGQVTIVNQAIAPNTNYLIAVSNDFGPGGNFNLCLLTFDDISACVTQSALYVQPGSPSNGSPDNGPYTPGESVNICFDLINYHADPIGVGNNCQWLQGIVPVFGDCWDMTLFDPLASTPPSLYGGNWGWYSDITYNVGSTTLTIDDCDGDGDIDLCHITEPACCNTGTGNGQVVPPGWFANMGGGNPNNTFGDGNCCNCDMGPWTFCFTLTTKQFNECDTDPSFTDCTVKIFTFADGQTGSWNGGASICGQDIPQTQTSSLNCCQGPEADMFTQSICDGSSTSVALTSIDDPNATFEWTVSPDPHPTGATGGSGDFITQILNNPGSTPITVFYEVVTTSQSGCPGLPVLIPVTVLPELTASIPPAAPVCSGSCTNLSVLPSGGSPPYQYEWSNTDSGPITQVCPVVTTDYTVTVTDFVGCSTTAMVTVNANSNITVNIASNPGDVICTNDPNAPISLTATASDGDGNYSYEWFSLCGGTQIGQFITIPAACLGTNTFSITVTDGNSCTGEQQIDITVNAPIAPIFTIPPPTVCVNSPDFNLNANVAPSGGTWGCSASPIDGNISPMVLGVGVHDVCYTYTTPANCSETTTIQVTVTEAPDIINTTNASACLSYTLPTIQGTNLTGNEAYYTGSGGVLPVFNAGDVITTTTTLYVYDDDGSGTCGDEEVIVITITPAPSVDDIADITVCNSYTLPAITGTNLTGNEAYYSGTLASGTTYNPGDIISTTTTLYIFDGDNLSNCYGEESFVITIAPPPDVNDILDVTACNNYTLPAITGANLTGNQAYYTATGATGTMYNAGDVISASTTLFIYDDDGSGTCGDEEMFMITIVPAPVVTDIIDPTACNTYTLPAITGMNLSGNQAYYTATGGAGTTYNAGDVISATTTLFIFDDAGVAGCTSEEQFTITIVPSPVVDDITDPTACNTYTLPTITGTNLSGNQAYHTATGGAGTTYNAGDVISATTTLFIFDDAGIAGCTSEEQFTITILPSPVVDDITDPTACNTYTLPTITGTNLSGNQAYYTATSGAGTTYNAGDAISVTTTLFIFDDAGVAGCTSEEQFTITIVPSPVVDDITDPTACNTYTLPNITGTNLSGNQAYYTTTGGAGTSYNPGDVINSTTTLFIFDDAGIAGCTSEEQFTITIVPSPVVDDITDPTACDTYTLPNITGTTLSGNEAYYTATGGAGTSYNPGDVINSTTTLFIFDDAGVAGCTSEEQFTITIVAPPVVDDITDPTACNNYTLPAITGTDLSGNEAYYTATGGAGTSYNPGDVINSTTTLFIFDDAGLTGCTSEEEFTITIVPTPVVDDITDPTACDTYTLPSITGTTLSGNEAYYTATGGAGTSYNPGDVINSTTTLFIFDDAGIAGCTSEEQFTITIISPPVVDDITDVVECDNYTLPSITGTALSGNEAYYTGTGGAGTSYNAGDVISATTTLYIYDDAGLTGCTSEEQFTITIIEAPVLDIIAPVTACDQYVLPPITGTNLPGTEAYFTGPNGTGTSYGPGTVVTFSQICYAYVPGLPGCTDEQTLTITIDTPPLLGNYSDVTRCGSYTLPPITGSNLSGNEAYYTGSNGTGTSYNPGDIITTSGTIYVFGGSLASGCVAEESFTVTITPAPVVDDITDLTACDSYTLPNISGTDLTGNEAYYTGAGGTGTSYNPGDAINLTTTLYIFDEDLTGNGNCISEEDFTITIVPSPSVDDITDPIACNTYTLPNITGVNLSGNEAFYTGSGGTGTSYNPGDVINTTTTLYIYDDAGIAGCTDEEEFTITITLAPIVDDLADVSACNTYTLPNITGTNLTGNEAYYAGTGGTGTSYNPGDVINTTTTLYIYDDAGLANCDDEQEFEITIVAAPIINDILDVTECDTYTLPTITGLNLSGNEAYYTGTGGTGTSYNAGDVINATTTLYIYDSTAPGCDNEQDLIITINNTPTSDFTVDPVICVNATSTIIYTGTAGAGATYTWNFNGGTIISGTGAGPYEIEWGTAGNYTVSLTVEENGCTSATSSENVQVDPVLPTPVINCTPTTTSVTFTWVEDPAVDSYTVTDITGPAGTLIGNTYTVTGLSTGQTVTIEVTAVGTTACGNTTIETSCTAENCPMITVAIDAVADICLDANATAFDLNATITGGNGTGTSVWAGTGITDAAVGTFDPNVAGAGTHQISFTYTQDNCDYNASINIIVNPQPTSDFTVDPVICVNDNSTITYTGTAGVGASYTWDFDGGAIISGTGAGPYEINWSTAGNYTVSLTVVENACSSTANSVMVQVDPTIPIPVVNCSSTTTSVTFTWVEEPGVDSYSVTDITGPAGTLAGNTYTVTGLTTGQSVVIDVTANSTNACGNTTLQGVSCTADNCPVITVAIDAVADICLDANATAFNLNATETGAAGTGSGVWTGTGITDAVAGTFDPNVSGTGTHTITYTYTESNCDYSATINIIVNPQPTADFTVDPVICVNNSSIVTYTGTANSTATFNWNFNGGTIVSGSGVGPYEISWASAGNYSVSLTVEENACSSLANSVMVQVDPELAPPTINCTSTTTSVTFTWGAVAGADSYTVTDITGPAGTLTGNSYTVTGLSTGQVVTIEVTAIGTSACGNSSMQANCTANNCPIVTVDVDPVADICLDANATAFDLNATVTGATGMGTGTWSGIGITDPVAGTFNPATAGLGMHTITYTYTEANCSYTGTVDITINPQPTADFTVDPVICVTDNSTISYTGSAGAGATYNWDFDGGTIISGTGAGPYEINWATAGSHNVSLTVIENGCTSTLNTVAVQVDAELAPPTINCTSTTTSVTFTWGAVAGADSYTVTDITGPAGTLTGNSYTVTGLTTGQVVTIEVTAIGTSVCGNSSMQASCTADNCPVVTLTVDPVADICLTTNSFAVPLNGTITGGTVGNAVWSGPGITDAINGTFDPNVAGVGMHPIVYTYTETTCSYTESITINVFATPTAEAGNGGELSCSIMTITLDGAGSSNGNYTWTTNGGSFVAGQNTLTPEIDGSGTYYLTVESNGCSSIDSVLITQDPLSPAADAGPEQAIDCNTTCVTLGGTGTSTGQQYEYVWTGPNSFSSNLLSPEVCEPGEYTLIVNDVDNNCSSPASTVMVLDNTTPPIAVVVVVGNLDCFTTSLQLDGSSSSSGPNITYQWFDQNGMILGATSSNLTASSQGNYTLVVQNNLTGCSSSDMKVVNDLTDYPVAAIAEPNQLDCNTLQVTLDGTGSTNLPDIVYSWSGPVGGIVSGGNTNAPMVSLPGQYTITVIDTTNSCENTEMVTVLQDIVAPNADAGPDVVLTCSDSTAILGGSGTSIGSIYSYNWTSPGITITNPTTLNPTVEDLGSYTLTVSNSQNGCSATDEVLLSENIDGPQGDFVTTEPDCYGDSNATISVQSVSGGVAPYLFSLEGNTYSSLDFFSNLAAGTYAIGIQDANGCESEISLDITQPDPVVLDIGNEVTLGLGDSLIIEPQTNIVIDTIFWSPYDELGCPDSMVCINPVVYSNQSYTLYATVVDENGCTASDDLRIIVDKERLVYIPTGFSPDNDGVNDLFMIYGGKGVEKVNVFRVFNRWGEVIYEGENFSPGDPSYGWDGFFKNKKLNPGVFVYLAEIQFTDGQVILYKGDVTLIR